MTACKVSDSNNKNDKFLNPAQFLSKLTQSLHQKTSRTYAYFQAYNAFISASTDLYNV